jgi:hypothetical protein
MKYIICIVLFACFSCKNPIARLSIDSGPLARNHFPIYLGNELGLKVGSDYYIENISDGSVHPVQVLSSGPVTVIPDFPANTTLTFELIEGLAEHDLPKIKFDEDAQGIQVLVGNKALLFYQRETAAPEGDQPDYYQRSGFIHPLYSPNGEILTDGFPKGHTHQNGIFNAWTNTTFKGQKVDFWNRQEQLGTIRHVETLYMDVGKLLGQVRTKLSHVSLEHGEVLDEEWLITVYPKIDYFIFDLESTQVNISQDTLFLNEYLYGGMAFRGSKEWNIDDKEHFTNPWKIKTSEGLINEEANHTKAKWVDASGMINGNKAGLTVFGFPENYRAPQTIRVHPSMPYWVYSPVVEGAFYIPPGETYISRYRYLVHNGQVGKAELDRIFTDMEQPVVVRRLD